MRLLFVFFASLFLVSGCKEKVECEKEVYLLPSGFRGKIMVFFNQEKGREKTFEGDSRVYMIPPSGYLLSQFPENGGCMNDNRIRFFYLDSLGHRTPLVYFMDSEGKNISQDENYVVFSLLSKKGSKNAFVIHLVGTAGEYENLTDGVRFLQPQKILDSLSSANP
jgi:hypothetical protein